MVRARPCFFALALGALFIASCGGDEPVRRKARPFPRIVIDDSAPAAEPEGPEPSAPPAEAPAPSSPEAPSSPDEPPPPRADRGLQDVQLDDNPGSSPRPRRSQRETRVPVLRGAVPVDRRMRVHALDVGQGSATLLELPCAAVLIDTGGEQNEKFDGPAALARQLDAFFAERPDLKRTLDLVLLTHPHIDHVRGLPRVLERYRVKNIVDNSHDGDEVVEKEMRFLRSWQKKHRKVGYRGVRARDVARGGVSDKVIDPVKCKSVDPELKVLFGGLHQDPGWGEDFYGNLHFDNQNNHSVVLRVDFGEASVLITGDLEEVAIEALIEKHDNAGVLDVDLYVVGHHGSHNGTTRELMEEMTPGFAVISMGPASREVDWSAWRYGHPRQGVVTLLANTVSRQREPVTVKVARYGRRFEPREMSAGVFATGWDGTVVFEASADGRWRTLRPPERMRHARAQGRSQRGSR